MNEENQFPFLILGFVVAIAACIAVRQNSINRERMLTFDTVKMAAITSVEQVTTKKTNKVGTETHYDYIAEFQYDSLNYNHTFTTDQKEFNEDDLSVFFNQNNPYDVERYSEKANIPNPFTKSIATFLAAIFVVSLIGNLWFQASPPSKV